MGEDSVRPTGADVAGFLAADAAAADTTLVTVDAVLTEALPSASRRLWRGTFWGGTEQTIVGYGDIVQPRPRGGDVEWFLIGLARQKRHVSLYVNAAEGRQYLARTYAAPLATRPGAVKAGAAVLTFTDASALDISVLADLARHAARLQSSA
ncbi:hypothetical protein [Demequina litorisediminis]|uniref:YdhG-like domain-containing protein n=1 Tax=Demequina litorisediminis TaxID=1849022 RepID=A0ABQ6IHT5_9MICO|nr:hypothetical protein [Demequina litorisediminis]GMA37294.1 hypothetical protein GCM10025876_34980 [Demequina litorisediminis]